MIRAAIIRFFEQITWTGLALFWLALGIARVISTDADPVPCFCAMLICVLIGKIERNPL